MAAEFIGSTILAKLISPPDAQIRGVVQDIHDQVLYLRDGKGNRFLYESGLY